MKKSQKNDLICRDTLVQQPSELQNGSGVIISLSKVEENPFERPDDSNGSGETSSSGAKVPVQVFPPPRYRRRSSSDGDLCAYGDLADQQRQTVSERSLVLPLTISNQTVPNTSKAYQDKIIRLEAQLAEQAQELGRVRTERDELAEEASFSERTQTATVGVGNRRDILKVMQGRRLQAHSNRPCSDDSANVSTGSFTISRRSSVLEWARASFSETISESISREVGASIRDLMASSETVWSEINTTEYQEGFSPRPAHPVDVGTSRASLDGPIPPGLVMESYFPSSLKQLNGGTIDFDQTSTKASTLKGRKRRVITLPELLTALLVLLATFPIAKEPETRLILVSAKRLPSHQNNNSLVENQIAAFAKEAHAHVNAILFQAKQRVNTIASSTGASAMATIGAKIGSKADSHVSFLSKRNGPATRIPLPKFATIGTAVGASLGATMGTKVTDTILLQVDKVRQILVHVRHLSFFSKDEKATSDMENKQHINEALFEPTNTDVTVVKQRKCKNILCRVLEKLRRKQKRLKIEDQGPKSNQIS